MLSVEDQIIKKLEQAFNPSYLKVLNESHGHSVPKNSETHFKVVMASDKFAGRLPVARHQLVYGILSEELEAGVHALALHLHTPEQWQALASVPDSPPCLGGSKR